MAQIAPVEGLAHVITTTEPKTAFHDQTDVAKGNVFCSELLTEVQLPRLDLLFSLSQLQRISPIKGWRLDQQLNSGGEGGCHGNGRYSIGSML